MRLVGRKGSFAWVVALFTVVSVINPSAVRAETVTSIPVGTNPFGVAITPVGTFAYVTNSGDGTVSKIGLCSFPGRIPSHVRIPSQRPPLPCK